jgi:hypothetical protein
MPATRLPPDETRVIDANPITAPTDKSMPPEKITSVSPIAAIPSAALSVKRFTATPAEKNPS